MAKATIIYTEVEKIIDDWLANNKLAKGQRYTFNQLLELDKLLCGWIGELKEIKGQNGMVKFAPAYYSIHSIKFILQKIDPHIRFRTNIIDYTQRIYKENIPSGVDNQGNPVYNNITFQYNTFQEVLGLSIEASYESDVLPPCINPTTLAVSDNKFDAIKTNIGSDDIEFGKQRAIVKTIAENSGLGYMCWLKPDFVIGQIKLNPDNRYSKVAARVEERENAELGITPNEQPSQAPTQVVAPTGQMAKEVVAKAPARKTTKKAAETPAPAPAPVPMNNGPVLSEETIKAGQELNRQQQLANAAPVAPAPAPAPIPQAPVTQAPAPNPSAPVINFNVPNNVVNPVAPIPNQTPAPAPIPQPVAPTAPSANDAQMDISKDFIELVQTRGTEFMQVASQYCVEHGIMDVKAWVDDLSPISMQQKQEVINLFRTSYK